MIQCYFVCNRIEPWSKKDNIVSGVNFSKEIVQISNNIEYTIISTGIK